MPGGSSSATATVIGSLPYTDSDTVVQGSPKWYLFTTPTPLDPIELGAFVYTADFTSGTPQVFVNVFSPTATTTPPHYGAMRKPFQIALAASTAYYLRVSGSGAGITHAYTITVSAAPTATAPTGALFIPDDVAGFPAVVLSGTDGTALRFVAPFPAGESADVIATGTHTGRVLVYDNSTGHLVLYDSQFAVVADLAYRSLADLSDHTFSIRTNSAITNFYVSDPKDTGHSNKQTVTTVTSAGAFGPTTWVLPNQGVLRDGGLAPSLDETILYVVNTSNPSVAPVNRWDLVNNVALTDLVAGIASYSTYEILVLGDSSIVVMYQSNTSTNEPIAKRYDASGATLNTYPFPGSQSFDTRLASAIDDPHSFWAWTKLGAGLSRFTNVNVSDGSSLVTIDATQFELGVYQPAYTSPNPSLTPRFGHSESCPFVVLRQPIPLPPPITGTMAATLPRTTDASGRSEPINGALTGYSLPPRHKPCPTV